MCGFRLVVEGLDKEVLSAIGRAEAYLLGRQAPDDCWRDYWLKPGMSEDWVTASCGFALASSPRNGRSAEALGLAANALWTARRAGGWGYNRDAVPDVDSSAWVLRFLNALNWGALSQAAVCLLPHIDSTGRAHTFLPPEEAGSWGWAHADVTPMVGLALAELRLSSSLIAQIRKAVLEDQSSVGTWQSFWWASDAYATAYSLQLLAHTGGVPVQTANRARRWLRDQGAPGHTVDAAYFLIIARILDEPSDLSLDALLQMEADGSWPPSPILLAPDKDHPEKRGPVYSDEEQIYGTAVALMALKSYLRGSRESVTQ
jgi:squalene cyclase